MQMSWICGIFSTSTTYKRMGKFGKRVSNFLKDTKRYRATKLLKDWVKRLRKPSGFWRSGSLWFSQVEELVWFLYSPSCVTPSLSSQVWLHPISCGRSVTVKTLLLLDPEGLWMVRWLALPFHDIGLDSVDLAFFLQIRTNSAQSPLIKLATLFFFYFYEWTKTQDHGSDLIRETLTRPRNEPACSYCRTISQYPPNPVSVLSSMGLSRQKYVWQKVSKSMTREMRSLPGVFGEIWLEEVGWKYYRVGIFLLWDVKGECNADAVQEDQKSKDLLIPHANSLSDYFTCFHLSFSTPRIHPPWVLHVGLLCSTQPEHEKMASNRSVSCAAPSQYFVQVKIGCMLMEKPAIDVRTLDTNPPKGGFVYLMIIRTFCSLTWRTWMEFEEGKDVWNEGGCLGAGAGAPIAFQHRPLPESFYYCK